MCKSRVHSHGDTRYSHRKYLNQLCFWLRHWMEHTWKKMRFEDCNYILVIEDFTIFNGMHQSRNDVYNCYFFELMRFSFFLPYQTIWLTNRCTLGCDDSRQSSNIGPEYVYIKYVLSSTIV